MGISQVFNGHITRWYNMHWKHHALSFPGWWLWSIFGILQAFAWLPLRRTSLWHRACPLPTAGLAGSCGMDSPLVIKVVFSCDTDFAGLISILACRSSSARHLRSPILHRAVCRMLMTSSMSLSSSGNLFPGVLYPRLPVCPL